MHEVVLHTLVKDINIQNGWKSQKTLSGMQEMSGVPPASACYRTETFKLHISITCSLIFSKSIIWAASSEFVSSSTPSSQILTAHAQPFTGARDLAFCLKVPLDSLLVWASSGGSGETARMRWLAWTFAARTGDKYQIRLTRSILDTHNIQTFKT